MAGDAKDTRQGKKPSPTMPVVQPPKPQKPKLAGTKPGVGFGGMAGVRKPDLPSDFEPRTGGGGIRPEKSKGD
ncbi:MAG TPA: hypothetical protein VNR39_06885 [Pseudolabrys sp.]|nr:hypothetical protein [Pseudolabrys sp.]